MIDINQCAIITKEDYNILPQGYRLDDDGNKRIIIKSKISKVLNRIDKHSVLLVTYNYLYKCNDLFYEIVRSWLKDGYNLNGYEKHIPLSALVFLEKTDDIRDFCEDGILTY